MYYMQLVCSLLLFTLTSKNIQYSVCVSFLFLCIFMYVFIYIYIWVYVFMCVCVVRIVLWYIWT